MFYMKIEAKQDIFNVVDCFNCCCSCYLFGYDHCYVWFNSDICTSEGRLVPRGVATDQTCFLTNSGHLSENMKQENFAQNSQKIRERKFRLSLVQFQNHWLISMLLPDQLKTRKNILWGAAVPKWCTSEPAQPLLECVIVIVIPKVNEPSLSLLMNVFSYA